jgi:DNA-binding XRE family transcriptional regulator
MNLNCIQTVDGQRFVLLPIEAYAELEQDIERVLRQSRKAVTLPAPSKKKALAGSKDAANYQAFELNAYVRNPVALARIQAGLTQVQLAKRMGVSQPYIAKIEAQGRVSEKTLTAAVAAVGETLQVSKKQN